MATTRHRDIPSLDGLRAVSIGIVFVAHAGLDHLIPGGFGVTVFFVISGFLITTLLRSELERSGRIALGAFYLRRAFRILPLFYAVLGLAALGTRLGLGDGELNVRALLSQVFHFSNYWSILRPSDQMIPGTGVYWSLAVEEHFYLLFPLALVVLTACGWNLRRQAMLFAGVCVLMLLWRVVLVIGFDVSTDRTYYASDTRMDCILLGCVAALIANPVLDRVRHSQRQLVLWAGLGAVAILVSLAVRNDAFRETFRYSLQSVAIVAIMRYVVAAPQSLAGRLLNSRVMVWFGQLSYAFYLVHYVVIQEVHKHVSGAILGGLIALVIATTLAVALQRLVERPAQALRDRLIARQRVMVAA